MTDTTLVQKNGLDIYAHDSLIYYDYYYRGR